MSRMLVNADRRTSLAGGCASASSRATAAPSDSPRYNTREESTPAWRSRQASAARVAIGPLLSGPAAAVPVAAVIEQQHVEAHGRQSGSVQDPVAHVSRVAVAQQNVPERRRAPLDQPAVQPLAICSRELQIAVGKTHTRGRLLDPPRWEVQQRVEAAVASHHLLPASATVSLLAQYGLRPAERLVHEGCHLGSA